MAVTLKDLKVKLFTDGADKAQIREMAQLPWIRGFTTNPSLMKAAKVSDYRSYARDLVEAVPDRHISFEVFSDDIAEMVAQARVISAWGANVYAKLPRIAAPRGPNVTWRALHNKSPIHIPRRPMPNAERKRAPRVTTIRQASRTVASTTITSVR